VTDDTADYVAITRLQRTYGDVCVRRAWDEMAALCLPDGHFSYDLGAGSVIELHGPEQLCAFGKQALETYDFYLYSLLNDVVDIRPGGSASGRVYVREVGTDKASGRWAEYYGRYDDDYAYLDGAWRFAGRKYQALARRGDDADIQVFRAGHRTDI